jgi:hypothetical protein
VIRRLPLLRTTLVVCATLAFAATDAVVKGHSGGTRKAVGNISATWALLPFLAGALLAAHRTAVIGATVGAVSTVLALGTYALVRANPFSGTGSHHVAGIADLGNRWLLLGLLGGAVLGVIGASLAARHRWNVVAGVTGLLLAMEPVARILWALGRGEGPRTLLPSPTVWAVEVGCGCLIVLGYALTSVLRPHASD